MFQKPELRTFKRKTWIRNLHMWSSELHIWRRMSCKHLFLWSLRFRLSWLKLGLSLHTNKVRCVYFLRVCLWRQRWPFRERKWWALRSLSKGFSNFRILSPWWNEPPSRELPIKTFKNCFNWFNSLKKNKRGQRISLLLINQKPFSQNQNPHFKNEQPNIV